MTTCSSLLLLPLSLSLLPPLNTNLLSSFISYSRPSRLRLPSQQHGRHLLIQPARRVFLLSFLSPFVLVPATSLLLASLSHLLFFIFLLCHRYYTIRLSHLILSHPFQSISIISPSPFLSFPFVIVAVASHYHRTLVSFLSYLFVLCFSCALVLLAFLLS